MSEGLDDRIHPATPARQQTIWREGDFAKSFELAAAIQMLGGLGIAALLFGSTADWLRSTMTTIYTSPVIATDQAALLIPQLQSILFSSLTIVGGIGICAVGLAIFSHWCQTGIVLLGNKISPDVGKLSPQHWWAKLFSRSNTVFTLMCLPKIFLAIGVMIGGCWVNREAFFRLGLLPADELGSEILRLALMIGSQVGIVLLIGSGIDYWLRYLSYQSRIRMTDQELRDEEKMQSRKGKRRQR